MIKSQKSYLYDAVKRIDLKTFIERESPAKFQQKGPNNWASICPFHKDSNPSFSVTRNHDGIWIYNCFGCNSHGTIIDFCQEKFDIISPKEAAILAAEKEGIKFDETLIAKAAREARVETDRKMNSHLVHCVASTTCQRLLRQPGADDEIRVWVAGAYVRMNRMLDDESVTDMDISKVGEEALRMIGELQERQEAGYV